MMDSTCHDDGDIVQDIVTGREKGCPVQAVAMLPEADKDKGAAEIDCQCAQFGYRQWRSTWCDAGTASFCRVTNRVKYLESVGWWLQTYRSQNDSGHFNPVTDKTERAMSKTARCKGKCVVFIVVAQGIWLNPVPFPEIRKQTDR